MGSPGWSPYKPVPENYAELVRKRILPGGIVRVKGRYVPNADMQPPVWVRVTTAILVAVAVAVISGVVTFAVLGDAPPAVPAAVEKR